MSDKFQPLSLDQLAQWIFTDLDAQRGIFGIPRELFWRPQEDDPFRDSLYAHALETPFGVAAGPHTQMAQNLVVAWLYGARFMELKTVQTLDELEVSKPCIDMQDEGYNVEWSQELKIQQSFAEYLRAWVLIHALHHKLQFPGRTPGVIFNMSVGYNMEGVLKPNVQWFLNHMHDAGEALNEAVQTVARYYPAIREVAIPARLSDNVTLSTMHGCPPAEIGKIAAYLIEERGLHTSVKLNPTLLGPERLRFILNEALGFKHITVPDEAFGHDLKYPDALGLLKDLQARADKKAVVFGVKLSNTLEVINHRRVFNPKEKMMYMSGRPLQGVTMNLAAKLAAEFNGRLLMSYAGGADAFNVDRLLASGMKTITTCSDVLRPGGYSRLLQYIENARNAMRRAGATTLDAFIRKSAPAEADDTRAAALGHLAHYAEEVLADPLYKSDTFERQRTKTTRPLGAFDCIKAPCTDECPIEQKVPLYMEAVRKGDWETAVEITREDNPLPTILGRACNHKCEQVCVRTHYDEPLAIREIKRFIMSREKNPHFRERKPDRKETVAVLGGGPCGLASAYFLRQEGFPVEIFEERAYPGGMVSGSIPGYRATQAAIDQDLAILKDLGIKLHLNQKAGRDFTLAELQKKGFKYIVLAMGAQQGQPLGLAGENATGVLDGLAFLRAVRENQPPKLAGRIGIIGGGDVAMDCARTAARVSQGSVQIIYRRTLDQMPAQREELRELLEEGIPIRELAAPKSLVLQQGRLVALRCARMTLGAPDASGRKRPVEVPGADFEIPLDYLVVAIGQQPAFSGLPGNAIKVNRKGYFETDPATLETSMANVFAGGDATGDGPETIVKALGDGKKIAAEITRRETGAGPAPQNVRKPLDLVVMLQQRARREKRVAVPHTAPYERRGFSEVVQTLSEEAAIQEAGRCLRCDLLCSICTGVCPNRAFLTYACKPFEAHLPVWKLEGGRLVEVRKRTFRVDQPYQVAVLTDFCNECGNCASFCPTAGKPYQDKPRLYVNRHEFEAQPENAFMLLRGKDGHGILGRFGGQTHELKISQGVHYQSPQLSVVIDPVAFRVKEAKAAAGAQAGAEYDLAACATLYVLAENLQKSVPALPAGGAC